MMYLEENLVALDVEVSSAEEAIRAAGKLLVEGGAVDSEYIEAMIRSFKENGPYFVLAPNIALPHARPEDGVKEASVSFVRLKRPVLFGSSFNDPVQFIFALGAASSEEHLALLQKLMLLLNNAENVKELSEINNYQELNVIIRRSEL